MLFLAGVGLGVLIGLVTGVVVTAAAVIWAKMQQDS